MGAGSYAAGLGPAGHDPVLDPSESLRRTAPQAALYDLAVQDFVRNPDGTYVACHPVDAEVMLRLGLRQGSVGSAVGVGNPVFQIRYLGPSLEAEVRDGVKVALKPMLDRKDISIVSIPVERREGGFVYAVNYLNLRLLPAEERSVGTR